jgi:hypothetical protein
MRGAKALTCLVVLLVLLTAMTVLADVPAMINYQGRLTDSGGAPLTGAFPMTFSIYDEATGGVALWTETHTSVNAVDGLFSVILGSSGSPLPDSVFAAAERYLGVTIGTDSELSPRTRLVASCYAHRVSSIDGAEAGILTGIVEIGPGSAKMGRLGDPALVVRGDNADSVVISPIDDITIYSTNDSGDETILMTSGGAGGAMHVTATDVAKGTVRTVEINPGDSVVLSATESNGDQMILITANPTGAAMHVSATDVAKGLQRTIEIAPSDSVVIGAIESNGDQTILVTTNPAGGALLVSSTDVAKGTQRTVEISPRDSVVLRATEANDDEVILITANPTGGAIQVTATDAAKADPTTVTGLVIINENGIFIIDEATSDTAVSITSDGDIETDGQLATGEDNEASGDSSSVSGGFDNTATGTGSAIGGGGFNVARGDFAVVGGGGGTAPADSNAANGEISTVSGGSRNVATATGSVIAGGYSNQANGAYSMVAGGYWNVADSTHSFAAGRRAKAVHEGAFVWADRTDTDFSSTASDQFLIRASGGVGIGTNAPDEQLHVVGNIKMVDGNQAADLVMTSDANGVGSWAAITSEAGGDISQVNAGNGLTGGGDNGSVTLYIDSGWVDAFVDTSNVRYAADAGYSDSSGAVTDGSLYLDDLGQNDATSGQVIKWNGSAWAAADDESGGMWTVTDSVLYTNDNWGIARGDAWNVVYGDSAHTHVNLGVACTTGVSGPSSYYCTVGGGFGNGVHGQGSTVAGGLENKIADAIEYGTIAGGWINRVTEDGATVGGGVYNQATTAYSTIGGGNGNTTLADYGTVSGGYNNAVHGTQTTVGGGSGNSAQGQGSTIAGGVSNSALVDYCVVGGGSSNLAVGSTSTISGGTLNSTSGSYGTISGGNSNTASAEGATVGGGAYNGARGPYGTVPGGYYNNADSAYSFAAGRRAKAVHDGACVWADHTDADFTSTASDQFLIRASGGVGIGTNAPDEQLHVVGNIRMVDGNQTAGYVLTSDANGVGSWQAASGGGMWTVTDSVLYTNDNWGIARGDAWNALYGDSIYTHVNFGVACTTGTSGSDYYSCTVGGGSGNAARQWFGTVSGGSGNSAGGTYSTVGGGVDNITNNQGSTVSGGGYCRATHEWSTVGGGVTNYATGFNATIAGGGDNLASGMSSTISGGSGNASSADYTTVGGGYTNQANGDYSVVPGGRQNDADSAYSFAAGRRAKAVHDGAFVWADHTAADFSSTASDQFLIRATGGVGIGTNAPDEQLHVVGNVKMVDGNQTAGYVLTSDANGVGSWQAAASGGGMWTVTDSVLYSNDYWGLARGNAWNVVYGDSAHTHVNLGVACTTGVSGSSYDVCTVGGGFGNSASNIYATVAGGYDNVASGAAGIVSGGYGNTASGNKSTISGGWANQATSDNATVSGGSMNQATGIGSVVSGGDFNQADGHYSTVGGGYYNEANGDNYATVPGGYSNTADSAYSFAAGRQAKAVHDGAFVWADHTAANFSSTASDQFLIRADGGVGINTNAPSQALHVVGNICYTGTIGACSDARYKKNVEQLDAALKTLLQLRGVSYDWKQEDYPDRKFDDQTHIGFIAQEVKELLPSVVLTDQDGYMSIDYGRLTPLLVEAMKAQQSTIDDLKSENANLEDRLAKIENMLQQLVDNQ